MNFLKKGLAQVSAAVEKAREATTMGGTSGEGAMAGSRSSGALPYAPGAPAGAGAHATRAARVLPDLSTLPEIRFDPRDPNEAHVAFLWSVLEGAPKNTQPHDDALASFLDGFAAAYGSWTPAPGFADDFADDMALPDDAAERHRYAPGGSLTGCATGHPGGVLRALAEATPRRRRALESALDVGASGAAMPGDTENDTENDTALANAAGLDLFDALRIAARSAHNRAVLASHGVLDELALTLQLATRRQNALAADVSAVVSAGGTTTSANAAARAEATARVRVLQRVSARIVDVLREYLEVPEERDTRSRRALGDDESPRRRDAGPAPAVKPLLECGALGALVETVRVQRLVCARVVGARAEAGARALERAALHALDGATRTRSPRKRAAPRGAWTWSCRSGRPARGGPRTRDLESRASVAARIAALRALRARPGATGRARATPPRPASSGSRRGGAEAAAAEDASGAFATRSVDTAAPTRSAHDADASVDPMSVALREADVAPPGACLAEAFGVLRGFVVADRGVPGEADADLESDRAVREGLLPAIVRTALASIADLNGHLNRDGNVRASEASSAGPHSVDIHGEARREREALSSVSAADALAGSVTKKKEASRATRDGEAASAFAGVGPAPPGGGGGGEGGFVVATGNPFADSAEADDAFGGAFGGITRPSPATVAGGVAGGFAAANLRTPRRREPRPPTPRARLLVPARAAADVRGPACRPRRLRAADGVAAAAGRRRRLRLSRPGRAAPALPARSAPPPKLWRFGSRRARRG